MPQWPLWSSKATSRGSAGAAASQPRASGSPGQQGRQQGLPQTLLQRGQEGSSTITSTIPGQSQDSGAADVGGSPWSQGRSAAGPAGTTQANPASNSKLQAVWNVARLPLLPVVMPVMAVGWVAFRGAKLAQRTVVNTGEEGGAGAKTFSLLQVLYMSIGSVPAGSVLCRLPATALAAPPSWLMLCCACSCGWWAGHHGEAPD
jgi:hypothetical protein